MLRSLCVPAAFGVLAFTSGIVEGQGAAPASPAQRLVTEWSTETRLAIGVHVNDSALQQMLPDGWTSAPFTTPTNRGANLTVAFVERQLALDGQGKPFRTGTSRYVVFVAPATNAAGELNSVVIGGLSPEGPGAYDVNALASLSAMHRSSNVQGEAGGRAEERWTFGSSGGDRIELRVAYQRAAPVKSRLTSHVRSAKHPAFTRSYEIDQAADVLCQAV